MPLLLNIKQHGQLSKTPHYNNNLNKKVNGNPFLELGSVIGTGARQQFSFFL